MNAPKATIAWTDEALKGLRAIGSQTVRQKLALKVDELRWNQKPEQLGKPLQDELRGLFRITFGRYRILYDVSRSQIGDRVAIEVRIRVVMVGIRKEGHKSDVYRIAQRLRRRGKL